MSELAALSDHYPFLLFVVEIGLLITIAFAWFFRHHCFKHLQDVKPERQLNHIHRQCLRACWGMTIILGLLIVSIWWLSQYPFIPSATKSIAKPMIDATSSTPQASAPTLPAEATPTLQPSIMLDLFEVTKAEDAAIEATKARFENALSGAYILHRCKRASDQEVTTLSHILQKHLTQLSSDPDYAMLDMKALYRSIVTAAEGSYQMVYAKVPCDNAEIELLEQQFVQFIMQSKPSLSPDNTLSNGAE